MDIRIGPSQPQNQMHPSGCYEEQQFQALNKNKNNADQMLDESILSQMTRSSISTKRADEPRMELRKIYKSDRHSYDHVLLKPKQQTDHCTQQQQQQQGTPPREFDAFSHHNHTDNGGRYQFFQHQQHMHRNQLQNDNHCNHSYQEQSNQVHAHMSSSNKVNISSEHSPSRAKTGSHYGDGDGSDEHSSQPHKIQNHYYSQQSGHQYQHFPTLSSPYSRQYSNSRNKLEANRDSIQVTSTFRRSQTSVKKRFQRDRLSKGDREEVWPPDVEKAFMKALVSLPKLGRRKVSVNGKPCGRNELIADFIFQETQKVRDRKQVSSHIQVLKNTRKHDPAFLRLLVDGGDDDGELEAGSTTGYTSKSHSPMAPSPHLQYDHTLQLAHYEQWKVPQATVATPTGSVAATSTRNTSTYGSLSPPLSPHHRYSTGLSSYQQHSHNQHSQYSHAKPFPASRAILDNTTCTYSDDHTSRSDSAHLLYRQSATTPDSAISLFSDPELKDSSFAPSPCSLLPTSFGLFIHYPSTDTVNDTSDNDGGQSTLYVHELVAIHDLSQQSFGSISIHQLHPEKFPSLYDLYERGSSPFIFLRLGINLNLEQRDGVLENTSLFGSYSLNQRSVRCLTTVYSFGTKVFESVEAKSATAYRDGKHVHSFGFVNQFFNSFLNGVRLLGTKEEVEVALCNLSVVQIYEDLDSMRAFAEQQQGSRLPLSQSSSSLPLPLSSSPAPSSPLLVMVYEFEDGRGTLTPYHIVNKVDMR